MHTFNTELLAQRNAILYSFFASKEEYAEKLIGKVGNNILRFTDRDIYIKIEGDTIKSYIITIDNN